MNNIMKYLIIFLTLIALNGNAKSMFEYIGYMTVSLDGITVISYSYGSHFKILSEGNEISMSREQVKAFVKLINDLNKVPTSDTSNATGFFD